MLGMSIPNTTDITLQCKDLGMQLSNVGTITNSPKALLCDRTAQNWRCTCIANSFQAKSVYTLRESFNVHD